MSVAQRIKSLFADPDEQLTVITEEEALQYDLGPNHRLEVVGQPEEANRPLQFRVYDESGRRDAMFTVFEPPVGAFDPDADVVDRYAAVIAGLVSPEAADTFREVITDLAEQRRNRQLLVVDDKIATLIQSTARVEFDPENQNQPWDVYLVDDHVNGDFGLDRVRIKADQWCSERPSFNIPSVMGYAPQGEQWRKLRHIWTLMYARDAGVEVEEGENDGE